MEPQLEGCQYKNLFLIEYACRLHHDAFFFFKVFFLDFVMQGNVYHMRFKKNQQTKKQESGVGMKI